MPRSNHLGTEPTVIGPLMTDGERNISHGLSGYFYLKCRCEVCRAAKSESGRRYRLAKGDELRAKKREYYRANAAQAYAKSREWIRQNPERFKVTRKAWEERNADRLREQKRVATARRRATGNLRAKEREIEANYRAANVEKRRAWEAARRARVNNADIRQISDRDWRRMVDRYRGCCHYCGQRAVLTQDHVIPLFRGGRHAIGNMVPACGTCNSSKNDRLIVEWRAAQRRAA